VCWTKLITLSAFQYTLNSRIVSYDIVFYNLMDKLTVTDRRTDSMET